MKPGQKAIYYILGDDERSALYSPHLDIVRRTGIEVLLLTDPIDAFMLARLTKFEGFDLANIASADLDLPEEMKAGEAGDESTSTQDSGEIIERIKAVLGERVSDVRATDRLVDSPARLVDPPGAPNQELQRVYRLLEKDYQVPKKVLEINTRHPILARIGSAPADSALANAVIEQIFENALLIEGLHPDPASMIARIQTIIESALARSDDPPESGD
jgi:molecular chaperone HtpG